MPIRREFRHLYAGPEWKEIRKRILERAENRCEQCRKPDRAVVYTYTWQTWICTQFPFGRAKVYHMVWIRTGRAQWRDEHGKRWSGRLKGLPRKVRVTLTVAHRDGNPPNMADENLACWCTWCHLHHDAPFHRKARSVRKDAARPLLTAQ